MHTSNSQWTAAATGRSTEHSRPRQSAWRQVFGLLRAPVWPVLLATVCASALLWAFQEVVHAGVLQGEARNRATAAYSHEVWRCNFTQGVSQRASCHAQLQSTRQIDATLKSPRDKRPEAVTLAAR